MNVSKVSKFVKATFDRTQYNLYAQMIIDLKDITEDDKKFMLSIGKSIVDKYIFKHDPALRRVWCIKQDYSLIYQVLSEDMLASIYNQYIKRSLLQKLKHYLCFPFTYFASKYLEKSLESIFYSLDIPLLIKYEESMFFSMLLFSTLNFITYEQYLSNKAKV